MGNFFIWQGLGKGRVVECGVWGWLKGDFFFNILIRASCDLIIHLFLFKFDF